MKKKILSLSVIVLCLAILSGGTIAYFTAEETVRNVITSGGIRIALVEQQLVDGALVDYPDEPIPVLPGKTVSKIVSVKGVEASAWIRMCYEITAFDADGVPMDVPAEELEKLVQIAPDSESWTFSDGWWYCNEAVDSGESTKPLFESVVFAVDMGNRYQESTVQIDVTAQAVQQANNGAAVLEAAGWPEA